MIFTFVLHSTILKIFPTVCENITFFSKKISKSAHLGAGFGKVARGLTSAAPFEEIRTSFFDYLYPSSYFLFMGQNSNVRNAVEALKNTA